MEKRKKYGGRKVGTPNKVTAEVRSLAQRYGPMAIAQLARIAEQGESDQARVAACKELLDRGYGKSPQPLEHSGDVGVTLSMVAVLRKLASRGQSVAPVTNGHDGNGHAPAGS